MFFNVRGHWYCIESRFVGTVVVYHITIGISRKLSQILPFRIPISKSHLASSLPLSPNLFIENWKKTTWDWVNGNVVDSNWLIVLISLNWHHRSDHFVVLWSWNHAFLTFRLKIVACRILVVGMISGQFCTCMTAPRHFLRFRQRLLRTCLSLLLVHGVQSDHSEKYVWKTELLWKPQLFSVN